MLQGHRLGVGELAPEVDEVLLGRAAESVDRLVVVPHHGHVPVLVHQEAQQHPLGEVGVLVLVHQHVAVALSHALAHVRALVQEPERPHHEVAEVQRPALLQKAVVVGVDAGELHLAGRGGTRGVAAGSGPLHQALGVAAVLLGGHELVLQAVDPGHEAGQQRGRIAADLVTADGEVPDSLEEERQAIGRRDRGQERVHPRLQRLVLEEAGAERVEGGHVQVLVGRLDHGLEPLAHLGRRGRGEGEGEDLVGGHPLLHEPGEAAHERAGLAGARAGHDQQWPAGMGHGRVLGARQILQQSGHAGQDSSDYPLASMGRGGSWPGSSVWTRPGPASAGAAGARGSST